MFTIALHVYCITAVSGGQCIGLAASLRSVIPQCISLLSTYRIASQIFEVHNFRGLAFSEISQKQFSRIKDSVSISTVVKKIRGT